MRLPTREPTVSLFILLSTVYRLSTASATHRRATTNEAIAPIQQQQIYLESLDDLEHVAYLAMRNFNITDDSLVQSSWQHQKIVASPAAAAAAAAITATGAGDDISGYNTKDRLALMLESFILHLRNGHLRQLRLDELRGMVASFDPMSQSESLSADATARQNTSRAYESHEPSELTTEPPKTGEAGNLRKLDEAQERCAHLVSLYVQEIADRQMKQAENGSTFNGIGSGEPVALDKARLLKLCQLVVRCHSADELVGLLDGPWHDVASKNLTSGADRDSMAAEPSYEDFYQGKLHQQPTRSLRGSLSQSLAKLCPLMLFQLHDADGMCSFRHDDRPPMITVWGFATLFVTIVSFVSLIGLSITPLLGPSANRSASSSNSDLTSATDRTSTAKDPRGRQSPPISRHQHHHHHSQQHRACLTLFEGLAVGSLVGSALFSLIPQAFELQERESNQGFLLKALIIFFGIYLFFCSERIMRIILDTRQYRKRKRRGSNLLAPPSTTVEMNLVGFGTSTTTGCSNIQQQSPTQQVGDKGKFPAARKVNHQLMRQEIEFKSPDKQQQTSNSKCVNFPAADIEKRNAGSRRRRERILNADAEGGAKGAAAGRAASGRVARSSERRQATKRHQSRTRRSASRVPGKTATTNRLKRRKTRYQLLVQSKRLHNDSLTLPAGGSSFNHLPSDEREPLRKRAHHNSSLSSMATDGAASMDDSSTCENSSSLLDESYDDSTTSSLDSSSSGQESADDTDTDFRLGQRSRQQQQQQFRAVRQQQAAPARRPHSLQLQAASSSNQLNHQHNAFIQSPSGQVRSTRANVAESRPRSSSDHHHHHHHSLSDKQDISTVAWMIVIGDGLHNFIDGISIGAAFSESILSGVSISVAVICEEFPHELGDFAVLVSSGMTVRQALGYNFLSACTCYLGMAVGIILGDVNDGASYISALAAGVFLYIALVDMMGELSASLEESSRDSIGKTLKLLLLQNVGIFIGISIILVLSFIDF